MRTSAGNGCPRPCQVVGPLQSSGIPGEDYVRAVALDIHLGCWIISDRLTRHENRVAVGSDKNGRSTFLLL